MKNCGGPANLRGGAAVEYRIPTKRTAMTTIRHACIAALAACGFAAAAPTHAGVDVGVGVSVQISQPGVYGRIDIGNYPQPQVILPQPVVIAPVPQPVGVVVRPAQPVYMWVPPGHRKDWKKHCKHYDACGVPVYFVRDDWYDDHVYPEGKKNKGKGHGKGKHD